MRAFEEFQDNIKKYNMNLIERATGSLENADLADWEKKAVDIMIQRGQECIENIEEVATIETRDGKLKYGETFGRFECLELGIGIDELMCFKGHNPMSGETGDNFRQIVNTNYGTNIPMSGVEQQALQEYESVAFGEDEIAKARTLMHLKEVQRDSGTLKNGKIYHLLATSQVYQDAKALCAGKNL